MLEDFTGFLEFTRRRRHSAGRFLEADRWTLLDIAPGRLSVACHVPDCVLNLGGFVFGGFTPTYVDYTAIWTCMTAMSGELAFLTTVNMKIDYLEPIHPPGFRIDSRLVNTRKRDYLIETRFVGDGDVLLAFAITNLRRVGEASLRDLMPEVADG